MSISRPEIDFPGGQPPAELQITDIWEGDGAAASAGDRVSALNAEIKTEIAMVTANC